MFRYRTIRVSVLVSYRTENRMLRSRLGLGPEGFVYNPDIIERCLLSKTSRFYLFIREYIDQTKTGTKHDIFWEYYWCRANIISYRECNIPPSEILHNNIIRWRNHSINLSVLNMNLMCMWTGIHKNITNWVRSDYSIAMIIWLYRVC